MNFFIVEDTSSSYTSLSAANSCLLPSVRQSQSQSQSILFLVDLADTKMNEYDARDISMIVNALAKLSQSQNQRSQLLLLFDNLADAAILIIQTFSAQGLATTINAYSKWN